MPRSKDESKREGILLAAKQLFAKNGFHNTSMSDIKKESGLPVGTIYTYFSSKEEIVKTIVDEGWAQISANVFENIRRAATLTEKVDVLINKHLPELLQDSDLIDILLTEAPGYTMLGEKLERITELVSELRGDIEWPREPGKRMLYSGIIVYFLGVLHSIRLANATGNSIISIEDVQQFISNLIVRSIKEGPIIDTPFT